MDYRKRMILSSIIYTILGFVMLAVSWESDFSFSMVLFSIVAFASFLSTFYFLIKKDIKQDYRKRMILNGIFSTIFNFAMLLGIWEGNGPFSVILISIIIFSIFTLVSLVSTFYFIIKKDIKKPDYRDKNGKTLLEGIKPYYSNKTHILIYRMSLVLSLLLAVMAIWAASITAMVACVVLVFIQVVIIAPLVAVKFYM
jgi:hypothetical protein